MTDPDAGSRTFEAVLKRKPEADEFAKLLDGRLHYLHGTVAESKGYRVLPGVEDPLPRLLREGYLLGLVTGNMEAAAHVKLQGAQLNRFFCFGGYGSDTTDRTALTGIALASPRRVVAVAAARARLDGRGLASGAAGQEAR